MNMNRVAANFAEGETVDEAGGFFLFSTTAILLFFFSQTSWAIPLSLTRRCAKSEDDSLRGRHMDGG